ncbi:lysophosphatidyl acyltransferase 5 [Striga asiatica]|uniref:Lysophosphatidyl acyltransferase 5 n=1 Tax=Striga asiatica TaxID=4170 RepID=A0A5A7P4B2_STRAF|nr:lysophosphatidyl acyltransferase 5 [Striga asiatica]
MERPCHEAATTLACVKHGTEGDGGYFWKLVVRACVRQRRRAVADHHETWGAKCLIITTNKYLTSGVKVDKGGVETIFDTDKGIVIPFLYNASIFKYSNHIRSPYC